MLHLVIAKTLLAGALKLVNSVPGYIMRSLSFAHPNSGVDESLPVHGGATFAELGSWLKDGAFKGYVSKINIVKKHVFKYGVVE